MTRSARSLWTSLETLHDVTYFAPSVTAAGKALGLSGFWMTYFAFRAAPFGAVDSPVVVASFAGFQPAMVARAIPAAWSIAAPDACLRVRATASAEVLRDLGLADDAASAALALLTPAVAAADSTGRPLFAANKALPVDDDPAKALWQMAGTIREHRGDGHIAALVARGLTGLQAHVLQVAGGRLTPERVRAIRGWTENEWESAHAQLHARGLVHEPPDQLALTAAGRTLLDDLEATTDDLSWRHCLAPLGESGVARLRALLQPAVAGVRAAGLVPADNPMGLSLTE